MFRRRLPNEFIRYLASQFILPNGEGDQATVSDKRTGDRLPSLGQLSEILGVSVAKLREQLEVARQLGFVEVRPRTGIRCLPYSFTPAVRQSLMYAVSIAPAHFDAYTDLRNQIESAYWIEAVRLLRAEDHDYLQTLIGQAWEKLHGSPIRIPHREHRELHLTIYRRLENPFVIGLLEAFWDAYEAFGLNLYADYGYLEQVWIYHQQMVDAICAGDFEAGFEAMIKHKDLFQHRPIPELSGAPSANGNDSPGSSYFEADQ
jgi:DNA-binding FadR family transcriptional regulator